MKRPGFPAWLHVSTLNLSCVHIFSHFLNQWILFRLGGSFCSPFACWSVSGQHTAWIEWINEKHCQVLSGPVRWKCIITVSADDLVRVTCTILDKVLQGICFICYNRLNEQLTVVVLIWNGVCSILDVFNVTYYKTILFSHAKTDLPK